MSSVINIFKDRKLIEVRLSGFMSLDELRKEGLRLKELALRNGKMKYIVDASEAAAMARTWPVALLEPNNWWLLARYCEEIAIVIQETDGEKHKFLEVAARNTGAKLKLFPNVKRAYEWLGLSDPNIRPL